ncbi:MAG: hypothetical protein C0417_07035 [Chlorobiaceae bacterium]|nr:hypothetical protein [Chlorobiaceae bacterium]
MSSKVNSYRIFCFLFAMASIATAQTTFTDLGISGGSSIVMAPTISVAPTSQLRVHMGRVDFLRGGMKGYNVFGLQGGFSTNLETFISMYSEQTGSINSNVSYGIGGKLLLPFRVPAIGNLALWGETISSTFSSENGMLPQNITRFYIIGGRSIGNFNPIIIAGAMNIDHKYLPIAAVGGTFPLSSEIKIGGEGIYNYFGMREKQGMLTGMMRILSNISVQVSGGYIHSQPMSSWIFSAGLSLATADLNLSPKPQAAPKVIVPSFEEMEKMSMEEKGIGQTVPPVPPEQEEKKPETPEDKKDEKQNDPHK